MTRRTISLASLLAAGIALSGCGSNSVERGVTGTGVGAASGAAVGALFGGIGAIPGALIGAGFGAGTGIATDEQDINLGEPVWRWGSGD